MAESKPEHAEALAKQLRESLAQRRPRPWKPVLAALAISSLILAGLVWWLYPRARAASLEIVALDGVFTTDETPTALAQLFAPPDDEGTRRLRGHKIVFHEQLAPRPPGEKPHEVVTQSDEQGQASVEWPASKAELSEFFARYISTEPRPQNVNDGARLFVWPKNAPLLIVDADQTLIAEKLDEQAATTLTKAAAEGWRIVYLTPAPTQAHDWRMARGWIHRQAKLPIGPVLGRRQFPSDEPIGAARRALLKSLRRFEGPQLAVVKTREAAQLCMELGLRTILLGNAPVPAEVGRAATWADVPVRLKE
jgi:hypothetical protein